MKLPIISVLLAMLAWLPLTACSPSNSENVDDPDATLEEPVEENQELQDSSELSDVESPDNSTDLDDEQVDSSSDSEEVDESENDESENLEETSE